MGTVEQTKWSLNRLLLLILFAGLAVFALFPLVILVVASLKPAQELMRYGLNLKMNAELFTWDNYIEIFRLDGNYLKWYGNSILITIIYTVFSLLFSSMVGYGIAMYAFKLRNFIFLMVLVTMAIPVEIIMLPLYKLMIAMKLMNSIWGVILPFMVAPLPIFFFRQYAGGLPHDFLDASRVDGCTEYGIYFRIMMPLMAPAFASMAILQALGSWNNFLWPLIVLNSTEKLTIPVGISTLITPYGNNYQVLIAGACFAVIPVLIVFLFFQRYFIEGMTAGGVKG